MSFQNLVGQTFGRLTVVELANKNKHGAVMWLCRCSCGKPHILVGHSLTSGGVTSCGCLRGDTPAWNRSHNMSGTPQYRVWRTMWTRCANPNSKSYEHYGARGIKVCERWQSFENFYADMGDKPSPLHSLERIKNDEGYSPENCKWATKAEQVANKRNNRHLTVEGVTLTITEWARRVGCTQVALANRIDEQGMTPEQAVKTPIPARPNSKLTDEQALFIYSQRGKQSGNSLAKQFNVHKKSVYNVWNGTNFSDITGHTTCSF